MNSIYYVPTDPLSSGKVSPLTTDDDDSTEDARQGKLSRGQSRIEFERLSQFFHVPINEAAKGLGVCATVLKKVCRKYGIPRWPHRKIKKLDTLLTMLESSAAKTTTTNPQHDDDVRRKIESVTRDRMTLLTEGKLEETSGSSGGGKAQHRAGGQKRSITSENVSPSSIARASSPSDLEDATTTATFKRGTTGEGNRKKRRVDVHSGQQRASANVINSSLEMEDLSSSSDQLPHLFAYSSPEGGSASSSGYSSPISTHHSTASPHCFDYPPAVEFGGVTEFASVEFNTSPEFSPFDYDYPPPPPLSSSVAPTADFIGGGGSDGPMSSTQHALFVAGPSYASPMTTTDLAMMGGRGPASLHMVSANTHGGLGMMMGSDLNGGGLMMDSYLPSTNSGRNQQHYHQLHHQAPLNVLASQHHLHDGTLAASFSNNAASTTTTSTMSTSSPTTSNMNMFNNASSSLLEPYDYPSSIITPSSSFAFAPIAAGWAEDMCISELDDTSDFHYMHSPSTSSSSSLSSSPTSPVMSSPLASSPHIHHLHNMRVDVNLGSVHLMYDQQASSRFFSAVDLSLMRAM